MIVQSVSAVLLAMYAGPLCAILAELFPTKVRFTALSIGYSLAVTMFGGFAPFIADIPDPRDRQSGLARRSS